MKIVYIVDENDPSIYSVDYYIDDELVANGTRSSEDVISQIKIQTSDRRVGEVYLDDISIKEI